MSKVRTLSRNFLKGHPKEGQPTFFVEKYLNNIGIDYHRDSYLELLLKMNKENLNTGKLTFEDLESFFISLQNIGEEKFHTIRAMNHFKEGDFISLRTWSGKSYCSPQIIIAPDIEIKKIWEYEVKIPSEGVEQWLLNGTIVSESNSYMQQWFNAGLIEEIAKNDGLQIADFLNWFKHPAPFHGQIICWSDSINY